jgi:hypothetical protein
LSAGIHLCGSNSSIIEARCVGRRSGDFQGSCRVDR